MTFIIFSDKCPHKNEEFVCLYGCEARCDRRPCSRPRRCLLGCHCKFGFVRNANGLCISPRQCTVAGIGNTTTTTTLTAVVNTTTTRRLLRQIGTVRNVRYNWNLGKNFVQNRFFRIGSPVSHTPVEESSGVTLLCFGRRIKGRSTSCCLLSSPFYAYNSRIVESVLNVVLSQTLIRETSYYLYCYLLFVQGNMPSLLLNQMTSLSLTYRIKAHNVCVLLILIYRGCSQGKNMYNQKQ